MFGKLVLLALVAATAIVALPTGAGAQNATPQPCVGVAIKDPAGDQVIGPVLGAFPLNGQGTTKGPDNLDITGVFFNSRAGVTTANIQITNLTKEVPPEIRTGVLSYQVEFKRTEDRVLNLRAELKNKEWSFYYATGERVETPAQNSERTLAETATKGRVFEGPNGLIEIEFPASVKPGTKLEEVFGLVSMRSDESGYVGYGNDSAPDEQAAAGKTVTIAECPPPEVAAPVTPVVGPVAAPGAPAATQQPAKPAAKRKPSCQTKAKKIKNAKKRAKALKKCKKSSARKR